MAGPLRKPPESSPAGVSAPEETLVVDPRGGVTPAQRVDQRLVALVGSGHPGLFLQAGGRPGGIRRASGG